MATDGWYVPEHKHYSIDDDLCEECRDCCGDNDYDDCCDGCQECGCRGRERQAEEKEEAYRASHPRPITQNTKTGGWNMNRTIAKLFEKTVDAVLVNKFYGHQIQDNDVSYIMLNGKQKELLAAAQKLEDTQKAHANVVTAKIVA